MKKTAILLAASACLALANNSQAQTVWDGGSGNWDTTNTNWNSGGTYSNGDAVQFSDTNGSGGTISVTPSAVTPASVTFTEDGAGSNAYIFDTNAINGTGPVTLESGFGGSVQFNVANGYSGGTTVNDGTLILGLAGALGSGSLNLAGGTVQSAGVHSNAVNVTGTTSITGTATTFFTGVITGSGTINTGSSGTGTTGFNNVNGFTGTITYTNNNLSSLQFNGTNVTSASLETYGASEYGAAGNFQLVKLNGSLEVGKLSGTGGVIGVTNAVTQTLTINQSADTTYGGQLALVNANGFMDLVKKGTGSLTLTNANNDYIGTTTVEAGTLSAEHNKALGDTRSVTVNGGTLDVRGSVAGTVTLGAGADLALSSGSIKFDLGTGFDQIVGDGAGSVFTISGGTFELILGAGFDYSDSYAILSNFGGANSVAGLDITGYDDASYTALLNDSGVLSFSAIPESGTFALLAGCFALCSVMLRRRV